ncbi:hypothetical protein KN815_26680 [Streptomyces sp. 4503]|uniref:Uncharacterized protein n=1 Tax=Streptomyces niphimycinicus TaxID=2842201 RepID=A0ABS6CKQ6_9ACTN|nr:hypothetical protein [Streptomyces niphimycinicus]MBU3867507.1 hypothetical protein [Streptomyces niphimycinicus]
MAVAPFMEILTAGVASGGTAMAKEAAASPPNGWTQTSFTYSMVYADDKLVLAVDDRGPATRHFKNGVYHHGNGRAEARFRNIRYWVK